MSEQQHQHVVIIGCGFGGLAVAKKLINSNCSVTIIDKSNHHLFQPLLYQVATADLSPSDIAWPIRNVFAQAKNIKVIQDEVTYIDKNRRQVKTINGQYQYDQLVVAVGAENTYFGHEEWQANAPGLKDLSDALMIRERILSAFEKAEQCEDLKLREAYMTFVVIGGGPTGVEMAGAIAEIAKSTLARDFRQIKTTEARIMLIEGGSNVLNGFDPKLCQYTESALRELGVELVFERFVENIKPNQVILKDQCVSANTIIWGAGVKSKVANLLDIKAEANGSVKVDPYLRLPDFTDVFIIGDAAWVEWKGNKTVPGIAPAAKQQGRYVGQLIRKPSNKPSPFKYNHSGNLATIGRHKAVVDLGKMKFKGWLAWYFWGFIHIYFLIGVRSATVVLLQWFWSYLTNKKPARIIIGKLFNKRD